jgi:hypothetical protein
MCFFGFFVAMGAAPGAGVSTGVVIVTLPFPSS